MVRTRLTPDCKKQLLYNILLVGGFGQRFNLAVSPLKTFLACSSDMFSVYCFYCFIFTFLLSCYFIMTMAILMESGQVFEMLS